MFLKVKSILQEHRYKYKTLLYNKGKVTCERRKKAAGRLKNGSAENGRGLGALIELVTFL